MIIKSGTVSVALTLSQDIQNSLRTVFTRVDMLQKRSSIKSDARHERSSDVHGRLDHSMMDTGQEEERKSDCTNCKHRMLKERLGERDLRSLGVEEPPQCRDNSA